MTIQGLLVASVAGLGIAGVLIQVDHGSPVEAAQVEEQAGTKAAPIDPWVYSRTQEIRDELALTNADLASLGLGLEESKAVLTGLKGWVEQNREQLEAKERAIGQARRELQLAQRSVRVGPRDETVIRSLPGLEEGLSNAATSLHNLYEDAGKAIEGQLTSDQRALWQTSRVNLDAGVPHRYRFAMGLNETQLDRIKKAVSKRNPDPSKSRYADADKELSAFQSQAIVAARTNQATNMEAVLSAEEEALPQEVELQIETPVGERE